jgi:hypothetical protein
MTAGREVVEDYRSKGFSLGGSNIPDLICTSSTCY